jgi:glutamate-ammonia-ligase adenylyltransferase
VVLPSELGAAVERAADPDGAAKLLERLEEVRPGTVDRLAADGALLGAVLAVAGASRSLSQLLVADPDAIEGLARLDRYPRVSAEDTAGLARAYRLEYLRIAARDLTGADDLTAVGHGLARLADEVLEAAWRLSGTAAEGVAVIGMGKLGGEELNYASDVDVLFVGDGDVRALLEVARRCFRVDADLRPEGRNGPLVRSLDAYASYWDRWAETWEFQALLKARPIAGPTELRASFAEAAARRVWHRPFGAEDVRQIRRMKARAEDELARRGLTEREIKRGRGGIRDIEFAVQLLQLVHGRHDPSLRSPTTLTALGELAAAGYVDAADADRLAEAYRFLRAVEHRLQLVDGAQVHAVPTDPGALERLARVLDYRDGPDRTATAAFVDELRRHQAAARAIHEQLFFRPLLEHFAGLGVELPGQAAAERLAAFGFTDAQRTRQALQELTHGLSRSSRMMQQLLPLLLGWLSESPDPDGGLLGLRTLMGSPHRAELLIPWFRDSPQVARRVCVLLGTSRMVGAGLEHNPDLVGELAGGRTEGGPAVDRSDASPDVTAGLVTRIETALAWREGRPARMAALRRFKQAEEMRIAAADIIGLLGPEDVEAVGSRLTALAEAVLDAAVDTLAPSVPMAIVAMGRFGGAELSYASDLDLLLVHDASDPRDVAAADAEAEDLLRLVKGPTPAERVYLLDADLRPEGRQGPLIRSLAGYAAYYQRWAQTWERQALLRARPVAGDRDLGRRFLEMAAPFVDRPLTENEAREIRRMKARIERERIPKRDDPDFHLKLGRGSLSDVEWTVQLLQLRHGVRATGTMAARTALEAAGALAPDDSQILADAYRFCERTRNRLYLVRGAPGDALPARADHLAFLARSLGMTPAELRETYRRVTRRARDVTERIFYGAGTGAGDRAGDRAGAGGGPSRA